MKPLSARFAGSAAFAAGRRCTYPLELFTQGDSFMQGSQARFPKRPPAPGLEPKPR